MPDSITQALRAALAMKVVEHPLNYIERTQALVLAMVSAIGQLEEECCCPGEGVLCDPCEALARVREELAKMKEKCK